MDLLPMLLGKANEIISFCDGFLKPSAGINQSLGLLIDGLKSAGLLCDISSIQELCHCRMDKGCANALIHVS